MRKKLSLLVISAALVGTYAALTPALGQTYIRDQLAEARDMPLTGGAFTTALHDEYMWIAGVEYGRQELSDSLWYKDRAVRAANGEEVPPLKPEVWGLPPERFEVANGMENRLMAAFARGGKYRDPRASARAQVALDCYIHDFGPGELHSGVEVCPARFEQAMLALTPPQTASAQPQVASAQRDYLVYFDWDKSEIRSDAGAILEKAAAVALQMKATSISVVGHADRSGRVNYNQRLSDERAATVARALGRRGVSVSKIETSGKSETDLRVSTPDNVREQENRRVEIHFE